MLTVLLLVACGGSQSDSKVSEQEPPPPPSANAALDAIATASLGESKLLSLDNPGGFNGAPEGMNFLVPPGTVAIATSGKLSDGSSGITLEVPQVGDALVCTQPVAIGATTVYKTRLHLAAIEPGPAPFMGLNVELRARGPGGELVSPGSTPYVAIKNLREAGGFVEWDATVITPPGAVKGEFCTRFVSSTGKVEIDSIELVATGGGAEGSDVATGLSKRWELDAAGGKNGAPEGFEFIVPGPGAEPKLAEEGGARGISFVVSEKGNAIVCSENYPVAGPQVAKARFKLSALQTDARPFTGFVAEVRAYDPAGGLKSAGATPYVTLATEKVQGDWKEIAVPFVTPPGAVTARSCFRFVESTGNVFIDWVGLN